MTNAWLIIEAFFQDVNQSPTETSALIMSFQAAGENQGL